jgi:hypothetical protein
MNDVSQAREDLSLKDDIAEVHREIQVRVNRVKAARQALAEADADLDDAATQVAGLSPEAAAYIAEFRNPATPEPTPLAPDVPPAVVTVGEGEAAAGGATEATGK